MDLLVSRVRKLTMYLLDFGTNGLAPLDSIAHVADSLLLDQTEKIQKFIRIINRELDRRKEAPLEHGVGTIALYREVTGKQEPTMVILMDSYESMKDEPYETDLFKLFMRISREGLSIGVHLIITASRQNNLRAQLYSNFKHQLTLPQNDISEVRGIVGATPLASTMEDIKGRALMKRDEVDVVQFAYQSQGTMISKSSTTSETKSKVLKRCGQAAHQQASQWCQMSWTEVNLLWT